MLYDDNNIIYRIMNKNINISKKLLQELHDKYHDFNDIQINKYITYNDLQSMKNIKYAYNNISESNALKLLNECINNEIHKQSSNIIFILIPQTRILYIFNINYLLKLANEILDGNKYNLNKIYLNGDISRSIYKIAIIEAKRVRGRILTEDMFE